MLIKNAVSTLELLTVYLWAETSLYQAGLSGAQGRGKGQNQGSCWLELRPKKSHAVTSQQKSSGITCLIWSSFSCSCGCVEREFFRITEFTAALLQWQGIWETLGKQQAFWSNIKKLGILMLPSLKHRRMEIENICVAQKYQKELWYWAVSLQKENWYNLAWSSEAKPRACCEMLTDIFIVFCRWECRNAFFDLNSLLLKSNCSALLRIILLWHKRGAIVLGPFWCYISNVASEGIILGNFTLQEWLPGVIWFERTYFS